VTGLGKDLVCSEDSGIVEKRCQTQALMPGRARQSWARDLSFSLIILFGF